MEEKINKLHEMIKEVFGEAVSVNIFVNHEGIEVDPKYRTNLDSYSMKNIRGEWVNKSN